MVAALLHYCQKGKREKAEIFIQPSSLAASSPDIRGPLVATGCYCSGETRARGRCTAVWSQKHPSTQPPCVTVKYVGKPLFWEWWEVCTVQGVGLGKGIFLLFLGYLWPSDQSFRTNLGFRPQTDLAGVMVWMELFQERCTVCGAWLIWWPSSRGEEGLVA